MNKVVLVGRLTKDPELRFTPGTGMAVTTITLAVDRWNSKTNQNEADFIPVVIWGKRAESVANYMNKGSQIAISGRIQTRSYDAKDGTKRYVTEVVTDAVVGVEFCGSKNNSSGNQNVNNNSYSNSYDDITPVDDGDLPF